MFSTDEFSQIWNCQKPSSCLPLEQRGAVRFLSLIDEACSLDLNSLMIQNKESTYFLRVQGHAMKNAGIFHGDIAVVDRSIPFQYGSVVIAIIERAFLIRRLMKDKDKLWLESGNPNCPSIEIKDSTDFEIWGVVAYTIHKP